MSVHHHILFFLRTKQPLRFSRSTLNIPTPLAVAEYDKDGDSALNPYEYWPVYLAI